MPKNNRNRKKPVTGSGGTAAKSLKVAKKKPRKPRLTEAQRLQADQQWRDDLAAQIRAEKDLAALRAQQAATARAQELATRVAAPAGNRGDGSLYIAFVRMGQGDCTIISTPKGQTVMIDCGSDATEARTGHEYGAVDDDAFNRLARDTLYSTKFLGGAATDPSANRLDILILTHSDTDHYNKISTLLSDDVKIYTCYHSGKFDGYATSTTSTWIRGRIVGGVHNEASIKAVTANESGAADAPGGASYTGGVNGVRKIGLTTLVAQDVTTRIDRLDARRAIRILEEPNCNISILSSNVKLQDLTDGSNNKNRGSIVTLIEIFDKKILICGDATSNTERYIKKAYPALTNLDVMQAPHHGSETSSSQAFINAMLPSQCIASTGKNVVKDHLPRAVVLARYPSARMPDNAVTEHGLYHWVEGHMGSWPASSERLSTLRRLYTTGSSSTMTFRVALNTVLNTAIMTLGFSN